MIPSLQVARNEPTTFRDGSVNSFSEVFRNVIKNTPSVFGITLALLTYI